MDIKKIKEDYLYKQYKIIPNGIYSIWLEEDYIQGEIINFDGSQMILNTTEGIRIINRKYIIEMKLSKIDNKTFKQVSNEFLNDYIDKYINRTVIL